MKIEVTEYGTIELLEVYNTIELRSDDNEIIRICMRDSGFEFTYEGNDYHAKEGLISKILK